jgi:HAD superfamily hydrolase (TIGR01509 family)
MKAVLFDMDGVLVLSNKIHLRGYREALRTVGIKHVDYRLVAGMRTAESMKLFLKAAGKKLPDSEVLRLIAHKQAVARRLLSKHLPLAPGCFAVLKRLHERFQLALVSSTSRKNVDHFLTASKTRRLFSVVLSGNDVGRAKPSPDPYRKALQSLKLRASEAFVVEDAVNGVQSARALGLLTIALSGTCSIAALKKAGAKKIFHRLTDIVPYAEQL